MCQFLDATSECGSGTGEHTSVNALRFVTASLGRRCKHRRHSHPRSSSKVECPFSAARMTPNTAPRRGTSDCFHTSRYVKSTAMDRKMKTALRCTSRTFLTKPKVWPPPARVAAGCRPARPQSGRPLSCRRLALHVGATTPDVASEGRDGTEPTPH